MIIPSKFFDMKTNKMKKETKKEVPSLKQLALENINLSEKELKKELAKQMINPYYFSKRYQPQYKIDLDSHHINHTNSKITISSKYELEVEISEINSILREMSITYARLINQYKFTNQTVFSTVFDKQDEVGFELDKTNMFISFKINQNLTKTDIDEINIESQLYFQIEN